MPAVRIEIERLVLRSLAQDAVNASASLLATLRAAAFGKVTQTLAGKVLIEASAAGTTTRYEIPVSGATPQDIASMLSRLLDRYDVAVAALGLPTSLGTGDDALILAQMLSQMTLIRAYGADFSTALANNR